MGERLPPLVSRFPSATINESCRVTPRNLPLSVLLRNAKENNVRIIPIILRPCLFAETEYKYPDPRTGPERFTLASIQAAGSPDKALSEMTEAEQDRTLLQVARALRKLVSPTPILAKAAQEKIAKAGTSRDEISKLSSPLANMTLFRLVTNLAGSVAVTARKSEVVFGRAITWRHRSGLDRQGKRLCYDGAGSPVRQRASRSV